MLFIKNGQTSPAKPLIALLGLIPELERFAPPAEVFDKSVYSAFHDGRLHPPSNQRGHTLVVTGAETDICVLSTALPLLTMAIASFWLRTRSAAHPIPATMRS